MVTVLALIAHAPGAEPGRTSRAFVIAAGAFMTFGIPAAATSIGLLVLRRRTAGAGGEGSRR